MSDMIDRQLDMAQQYFVMGYTYYPNAINVLRAIKLRIVDEKALKLIRKTEKRIDTIYKGEEDKLRNKNDSSDIDDLVYFNMSIELKRWLITTYIKFYTELSASLVGS